MCATFQAQKRNYELLNDDDIEGQVPGLQNSFFFNTSHSGAYILKCLSVASFLFNSSAPLAKIRPAWNCEAL